MPPQMFTEGSEREAEVAARRKFSELPGRYYTQDELDVAFARYQRYREEQSQLLQGMVYLERIIKLLAEFHALKNIVLDTHEVRTGVGLSTRQLWAAFGSDFSLEKRPRPGNHCAGRSEVHAILSNAHEAKLRLKSFTCTLLGFGFFSDKLQDYASYGRSLIYLKSLDLVIYDVYDRDGFSACLSSGRVLRFLTAAPHLERLRLGIYLLDYSPSNPANLEHFVGDFRWTSLVQVAIEGLSVKKNGFIEFLERHSSTLKTVELRDLGLMDGTWTSIFQMMRTLLELDEVGFHGLFADNDGSFVFGMTKTVSGYSFTKNVHDYILGATDDFQPIEAYLNEYRGPRSCSRHRVLHDHGPRHKSGQMSIRHFLYGPVGLSRFIAAIQQGRG